MSTETRLKVLVVGSGAREHALCAAIVDSPRCGALFAWPGNPGIAELGRCLVGRVDDLEGIVAFAKKERVDLVVVGPEMPLVLGLVDALRAQGIATFGPSRAAALLEGSKVFSKEFMARHGIPTAPFAVFDDADLADKYVASHPQERLVIKADGLCAGKGVVVAADRQESLDAIETMMRKRAFGEAGARVVVEECLVGAEVSFHVVTDGTTHVVLADAQDHKRIFDGDRGPNTGGMGAYSPTPFLDDDMRAAVMTRVVVPTLAGLNAEGRPFCGVLFVGLMIRDSDFHVLEFNVRFGDPETAVLLARYDGDVLAMLDATARGQLAAHQTVSGARDAVAGSALAVVIAAPGYPDTPQTGGMIGGLGEASAVEGVTVLHAGTRVEEGQLVAAGGRVLCVVGRGNSLDQAHNRAYRAVDLIQLKGAQVRRDIAAAGRQK